MRDLIERFCKVKQDDIYLSLSLEFADYCLEGSQQLSFTEAPGAEAVLGICEYGMLLEEAHHGAIDNVL